MILIRERKIIKGIVISNNCYNDIILEDVRMSANIVLLSGTPGTGKTTVATFLQQQYDYQIVSIGEEVLEKHLYSEEDPTRDTKIVDETKFKDYFKTKIRSFTGTVIMEGHYADLIEHPLVSLGIILRCHPHILEDRLKTRNYSNSKINENIQAELVGDPTSFFLSHPNLSSDENIFEIRSDIYTINELAAQIHSIIQHPSQNNAFKVGILSWLSDPSVHLNRYFDHHFEE